MTTIDVTDPKWQLSDDFKPDKESLWKYPAEKDGWVLAHNMIRKEVNDLIAGMETVHSKFSNSTPEWAVNSIKALWTHHYDVLIDHHRNEEEIMNPFIKTRVNFPDKFEADHEVLMKKMNDVNDGVQKLTAGDSLDNLINLMKVYKTTMFPHLEEEELVGLPLLRAYFTPVEVKEKVAEIIKTTGPGELGSMIDSMGIEYFRSVFMPQEGIPFFVWFLKFRSDHNHFIANVKCHFDSLKTGAPVSAPEKASLFWWLRGRRE